MHYMLYMKCVGLCHNGRDYGLDANNIKHILEIIKGQRLSFMGANYAGVADFLML